MPRSNLTFVNSQARVSDSAKSAVAPELNSASLESSGTCFIRHSAIFNLNWTRISKARVFYMKKLGPIAYTDKISDCKSDPCEIFQITIVYFDTIHP